MPGRVKELHRKPETPGEHGLPKPSVPAVQVTVHGVDGDFNRYRHEELHDEADSAILLMPEETLARLRSEGWPVHTGDLGENITTSGIPYDRLTSGTRVRAGEVTLQVSRACDPCNNLYELPYVGAKRGPEFLKTMMGRRGWYCRVLTPGQIRVDDPVEILSG
jgi:MOSC domain-containing protein YiiM